MNFIAVYTNWEETDSQKDGTEMLRTAKLCTRLSLSDLLSLPTFPGLECRIFAEVPSPETYVPAMRTAGDNLMDLDALNQELAALPETLGECLLPLILRLTHKIAWKSISTGLQGKHMLYGKTLSELTNVFDQATDAERLLFLRFAEYIIDSTNKAGRAPGPQSNRRH